MTLEQFRDIVVIVYGAMGVILFLALTIAAFGLLFAVRALTRGIQTLLDDSIRPTLDEVHKTAQNVRGTTEFVADSTVHPLIRAMSVGRGIKRGVASVAGIRNRRK